MKPLPTFAADAPIKPLSSTPDEGALHALGHGALAGATFNFGDELRGVHAAGPSYVPERIGPFPARTMVGAGRLAKNWLVGGDPDALAAYEQARDAERAAQESAKAHHPYLYGAGEVAGSVPAMAALPEAGAVARLAPGAGRLARMGAEIIDAATTGGTYGALSGAGEGKDIQERAMNAGTGTVGGIIGGAVAGPIAEAAGTGLTWLGKKAMPAVQFFRDKADPVGAAASRLRTAIDADQEMINKGVAKGLTEQQWVAARNAGEPVTLADLGAGNVQALLRSAANTSPEARAMLEEAFEGRFLQQNERFANTVRDLVPGGANAHQTDEQLRTAYNVGRKHLYDKSYAEGDNLIMSPTMERLMGSPAFTNAMKGAVTSGKDRSIAEGFGAFNPGVTINPSGAIVFNKGPTGVPQFPNLQYWDSVKRELDDMVSSAYRRGESGQGSVLQNLRDSLRNELDKQVPSYKDARGFAADYFGSKDALQAGRDLAGKKVAPEVIRQIMGKMKPDEQALFREGYASDLANRVIGNMGDTTNLTKGRGIMQSPNERRMATAIFGPSGVAQLESRMHLETIMDAARQAMGNSTTARQLIEAGLSGGLMGTYDLYQSGGNIWEGLKGLGEGAALGHYVLRPAMAAAAKKITGNVNQDIVRNVARLLTSNDRRELAQGLKMVQQNQVLSQRLRAMSMAAARSTALAAQAQPSRLYVGRPLGALQGPVPSHADDEKP